MAKSIIPNTFSNTAIPPLPKSFSILAVSFKTTKTHIRFKIIAAKILTCANSALRDIIEVIVPAPAITGNAKGTIEAVREDELSCLCLNISIPKTISMAIKNKTNDPATANSLIPTPITLKN